MTRARPPDDPGDDLLPEVDLHGLRPENAIRRVAQEIHACRVRRIDRLRVITGRGWGNRTQQPVLRTRMEGWLAGDEGRRLGVLGFDVAPDGGSLVVRLHSDGSRRLEDLEGVEE